MTVEHQLIKKHIFKYLTPLDDPSIISKSFNSFSYYTEMSTNSLF